MRNYSFNKLCVYLFINIFIIACAGCNFNSRAKETPADIVNSWIGKQIIFPIGTPCAKLGEYSPCSFSSPKPYKILLYTDSSGCTSCKLRIDEWKSLIKEADTTMAGKVDFLFYFYPKTEHALQDLIKQENFKQEIRIDQNDQLNITNNLPKNMDYQCFLLDKDNKVLLVGNPTLNHDIWKMQQKIINGGAQPNNR